LCIRYIAADRTKDECDGAAISHWICADIAQPATYAEANLFESHLFVLTKASLMLNFHRYIPYGLSVS
jgi:hypothetical protein